MRVGDLVEDQNQPITLLVRYRFKVRPLNRRSFNRNALMGTIAADNLVQNIGQNNFGGIAPFGSGYRL